MDKKLTRDERLRIACDDFLNMQINIYAIYGEGKNEQFIILDKENKRIIDLVDVHFILNKISRSFDILGSSYNYTDLRRVFLKWKKTLPKLEDVICKGEI
ncbi:hypothetical protein [Actinobacillus minor]|uniref:hypothetical protein n=1 Tax=Actinobacillus minor TaxID=51047 RepID=UPI0026ECC0C4|nr:hypothetical protein [Actinobacillus minor]